MIINSESWVDFRIGSSSRCKWASVNTGLYISKNATRSVNTSAILDQPILNDKLQSYKQHQISLLKAYKISNILVTGCWITYRQNRRWLMKLSNRLRIYSKNGTKRETLSSNWMSQNLRWKSLRYSIEQREKIELILIYFWLMTSSL